VEEKRFVMEIRYTEEKIFSQEQVQELFLSVNWVSGKYPERLYKALMHSSTVITAWHGEQLVGLVRVLDDSEMVAYMHYVLVCPQFHGQGIAGTMIEMVKEKYKNYLYIEIMPEESKNAEFYQRFGFHTMEDGVAMQICNFGNVIF
jgi:GNAT superfamily N-acetyltransferase